MTRTTYLILATPRSGSTLLGQGLQASGLAGDPKEFFGHKMAFWMERWGTPRLPAYVARLVQTRATPNDPASGIQSAERRDSEARSLTAQENLRFEGETRTCGTCRAAHLCGRAPRHDCRGSLSARRAPRIRAGRRARRLACCGSGS